KRQHLRYRPRVDPKAPRRFPPAHTFNLNRKTNLSVKLHALHPSAPAAFRQRPSLPDFYSGATGLSGRFSEGFLLRRLQLASRRYSLRPSRSALGICLTIWRARRRDRDAPRQGHGGHRPSATPADSRRRHGAARSRARFSKNARNSADMPPPPASHAVPPVVRRDRLPRQIQRREDREP